MAGAHRVHCDYCGHVFLDTILDPVSIIFDDLGIDLVLAYRRWSRIRKIMLALRRVRRVHPQIKFTYKRHEQIVVVDFYSSIDLFQFMLVVPSNIPKWRKV